MTRHGMIERSAAGAAPPATGPRAPLAIIGTDSAGLSRLTGRPSYPEVQRSGLTALNPVLSGKAPTIADTSRKSKSP
ncbi:hypothetical protein [Mesorhizobium sp. M0130]|uniref:hypothetical protein n=1 Tax=Mesorhizobium sp. M0130 TaxID=2956887 RepID=UPI003336A296